jgi:hypothetical protein
LGRGACLGFYVGELPTLPKYWRMGQSNGSFKENKIKCRCTPDYLVNRSMNTPGMIVLCRWLLVEAKNRICMEPMR